MERSIKDNFERDIIKKYRGPIWSKFIKALKEYDMIKPGDKIGVAISGGKDSLLLAKLMQEVKLHGDFDFDLEFLSMNPGFNEENLNILTSNCELLGIDVKVYNSNVFEVAEKLSSGTPCYMCARMRRGFLYSKAKELGCNKLALGHHFNDVIETTMLNILYAGQFKTMVPKIHAENFPGMELIRPMFLIKENDIKKIMKSNNIITMACGCKVSSNELPSKRKEIKQLIEQLDMKHEIISQNIFKSAENVNINAILGYFDDEQTINFNQIYEKEGKKRE